LVVAQAAAARERSRALSRTLDAWVRQTRETSELFRLQSEQMGRSLRP
jgi:uncharacterized protein YjiS (DUF1127 family)